MSAGLLARPTPPVEHYDLALFDLDGVVYVGPEAVPGAPDALARVRAAGLRTAFVTNNASRPPETVAEHLTELGVPATRDDVVTSAQAAAAVLARRLPAGAAVLVVGGEGLHRALAEVGLTPVADMADRPVAVVQGFAPDVGWRQLAMGTRAVRAGLPWVATNTDLTIPTPDGPAPGNGTLVAAVATASGVQPEVAGKPRPPLLREAQARYESRRPLMVGDRLDSDLEGARAAGMDGLHVLTGVHRVADLLAARPAERPHLLARDLTGLFEPHPAPEPDGAAWRCRHAVVTAGAHGLRVDESGDDPMDLLRAACAAAWAADGAGPPDAAPVLAALHRLDGAGPWER